MYKVVNQGIDKLVEEKYYAYGTYVLEDRAIPDLRDGLKPVQRRILHTMYEDKHLWSSRFTKCAAIVGNTVAKYHPHGDTSVYGALVQIAGQPEGRSKNLLCGVKASYPFIEGYGNFGSIDGDKPAAMRYPEARLSPLSEFFFNLSSCTEYQDNYLNSRKEPLFLPASFPFLLLNGTLAIAVGTTSDIPPHNLGEVCDGLIYMLKTPEPTWNGLLSKIKGPDWHYGGILWDKKQVQEVYKTGRGVMHWGFDCDIQEKRRDYIVTIKGIPPVFTLKTFLDNIAGATGKNPKGLKNLKQYPKGIKSIRKKEISDTSIAVEITLANATLRNDLIGYKYSGKNNWYVCIRKSEDDVIFESVNLMTFLQKWLDYAITTHKEYFRLEIVDLEQQNYYDMLRLKLHANAEEFSRIVKRRVKRETLEKDIVNLLKCAKEDVSFVLGRTFNSITYTNVEAIKERIKKRKERIKECEKHMKYTKEYLIDFYKGFKKYSRPRKTRYLNV